MVPADSLIPTPLETLMRASFWHRNRGRVIAILALVAVVLGASLFFRDTVRSTEMAGWDELEDLKELGQLQAHVDLSGAVRGTSAEPYALYNNAYSSFLDQDLDEASALIARLESEFPDHVLNRNFEVSNLKRDIEAEQAWTATHSLPKNNPQPSDTNKVTLTTELGEVVLGLYPEHSPAASRSFLELLRTGGLQTGSFNESNPGSYVILSPPKPAPVSDNSEDDSEEAQTEEQEDADESDAEEKKDVPEPSALALGRVPDRNRLSHYKGAVSFRRRHPGTIDADSPPQIMICLEDSAGMDNQQIVFGTVLEGLELLQQVSTREREETGALLKEPLSIQAVAEGSGLAELK